MIRVFVMTLLFGFSVQAADYSRTVCKLMQKDLAQDLKSAQDRFAIGEVDRVDVLQAEQNLLQAKFDCRTVTFDTFCNVAVGKVAAIRAGVVESLATGFRGPDDLRLATDQQKKVTDLCN